MRLAVSRRNITIHVFSDWIGWQAITVLILIATIFTSWIHFLANQSQYSGTTLLLPPYQYMTYRSLKMWRWNRWKEHCEISNFGAVEMELWDSMALWVWPACRRLLFSLDQRPLSGPFGYRKQCDRFDSRSSLNFFQVSSFQLLKLKYLHCDGLHIILFLSAVQIYDYFIYSYSFLHLRDKYELTIDQLPVGWIAQLVRALHWYRRGDRCDSRSMRWSSYNSIFIRSSNIWLFYIFIFNRISMKKG